MTYALLPDLDQALVTYLDTHPALLPLHAGRVGTKLAAGDAPAVRTAGLGGSQPWPWEGEPEFQIEWWGGDEGQANLLARTGEAALYGMRGPVVGGWVTGVAIQLSKLWSPDDQTGRARYITQVKFLTSVEAS